MNIYTRGFLSVISALCCYEISTANDFYVRTDIGFSKSTKIDNKQTFYKKGGEKRLNSGITYSLGLGYKFNDHFRAELTYNKVNNLKYSAKVTTDREYKQKIKLQAVMLNSYYDISSAHKIKPYAGIGLGYTNIKPGEALRTSDSNAMTYKANNFTYSLMTGVSVNMTEKLNLDIGYRFQDYGKTKKFYAKKLNDKPWNNYPAKDSGIKIRTHSLTVGMRYNFTSGK